MTKIVTLGDISEYLPIRLEKGSNGLYPFPVMRCGVLTYYQMDHQIIWGCVKSNRVGPTTISPPAGIQDIIIMKDGYSFTLEVGKPLRDLKYDFLNMFIGVLFRDQAYQDILNCLVANKFEIYVENPLVTAIHETREEHGVDLRKNEGRDYYLLNTLVQLPIQTLSGKRGASAQSFWVASLNNLDDIVLSYTTKIENKIRRNFGREFYEQGCWGTLPEFKNALLEERKLSSLMPQQTDLVTGVLEAYDETIELLERLELLIKADFKKTVFPLGEYSFFPKPHKKNEREAQDAIESLELIPYDCDSPSVSSF